MNTTRKPFFIAALLATFLCAGTTSAFAQSQTEGNVTASLSSREAYVGVPITLRVEIADATAHEVPEIPSIDGLRIESMGSPSRSSQTTIINGRRTDSESVTYAWRVTPREVGRFVIPALDVPVNGQTQRTRSLTFVATKSETGDLLFAEVSGAEDSIYVGQALPVTLKIWVKPFRDAQHGVTLSEGDMWQFVSEDPTSLGVFGERLAEMSQSREHPGGREVLRKDSNGNERSYYLYEIETTYYPKRPGAIAVGDVQVVVSYPTGLGRSRDLFSMFEQRLAVTGTRPVVADATAPAIEVLPVPQEGRPADYRGAIGRYDIVTHALPTQVKAGDPITLQIGIHGDGPLDLVQAPPLAELPELTKSFRVPNESLAGIVENGIKVFTTSVRPQREGITEIPAIPFTYFDPNQEEFITVRSRPIEIHVDKADILELTSVVGDRRADVGTPESAAPVISFENVSDTSVLRSQSSLPMWLVLLVLLAAPLAFVGTWFVRRFWWSEAGWAGPQFARPLTLTRRAITTARTPQELSTILRRFIADRLQVTPESLTRTEAIYGLRQRGYVDGVSELNDLLAQCERMEYAPVASADVNQLNTQALSALNQLKRPATSPRFSFTH